MSKFARGRVARSHSRRRIGRGSGDAGFTLIEIVFALAVLALVLFGLSSAAGSSQSVVTQSTLQQIAATAAQSQFDIWMSANFSGTCTSGSSGNTMLLMYRACWNGPSLGKLTSTDNTVTNPTANGGSGSVTNSTSPYTPQFFSVSVPGYPPSNQLGTIIIREPTAAEMPWYNNGNGPKWNGSNGTAGYPPSTSATAAGVTCLLVFVQVDIPAGPGHAPVHVALTGVRYTI